MPNDPSIDSAIGLILEKSLNLALNYDPGTRNKLQALQDKSVRIKCESPSLSLTFFIAQENVRVSSVDDDCSADVTISGQARDFLKLIGQPTHSLNDLHIDVSGKVNLLNHIKNILSDIDVDWEEPLTEILGVIPGHTLAESIRSTVNWVKRQSNDFEQSLPDLLTEELRALPSESELNDYYKNVDQLSSASQRIDARVQRLKRALSSQHKID
ncbi:MAG: SCP2 sterol-binding domain-containing protein [Agarilytica sp.]